MLAFLPLPAASPFWAQVNVTSHHNNPARTGENLQETILTPATVNVNHFGKICSWPVDGQVYAQPLYVSSLDIPGMGRHNAVFVATEHDSVYAFDADCSGDAPALLWRVSFLNPAAGVTTASVADLSGCSILSPEIGITGTPVIDPATNTLYAVAMTNENGTFFQRLHALDLSTGAERSGSPVEIQASIPGNGDIATPGVVSFYPRRYKNRAGLLLSNGVVYTAWSSHCDQWAYHGWIIGYDAATLRQVAVFNSTPDSYRGSFWMGGAAPATDASGNIYVVSGNGWFDKGNGSFGDSFLKLSSKGGLGVADYFTPFNQRLLDDSDIDLGSSGLVLLPDAAGSKAHPHLLAGAGKEGRIYLLDRDRMGAFQEGEDSQIVQSLLGVIGPLFGTPAYFQGALYFAAWNDSLKAFPISGGRLAEAPSSQSAQVFGYPGASPSISANGTSDGIVWLVESASGGTLHAYDAANLANELYNSRISGSRDALGSYVKFAVPTVANGRVYVGTTDSLVVYGLLDKAYPPMLTAAANAASFQAGPVAPGSLITLFGTNLVRSAISAGSLPLPTSLGGVTLSINGMPSPLLFVSPTQVNAQVPFGIAEGPATATLQVTGMPPVSLPLTVALTAPGLFCDGRNQAIVHNADGSPVGPANPARAGSLVWVYGTGLGAVTASIPVGTRAPSGNPGSIAVAPVTATLGGKPATVTFAGLTPGSAGTFQVSLRVPPLSSGSYPLIIFADGVASNAVVLNVSGS